MKKFRYLLVSIFAFVLIMQTSVFSEPMAEAATPVAILMKIIKDVQFKTGEKDYINAKLGQSLSSGDEVKTGAKSLAQIKFTDGSIINIRENSSLKIYADKKGKDISKTTHLDKGNLQFNVSKQDAEEFKFTTPTMVASIRGTEGAIDIQNDGSSLLLCTKGAIDIEALLGNRETGNINGGQFAKVGLEGKLEIGDISPEQMKKVENLKKSNTKKVTIKTNAGSIVIEYLSE